MSASKRKSGSEVEENRVKQAGGPGAMSHTGREESEELERKSSGPRWPFLYTTCFEI